MEYRYNRTKVGKQFFFHCKLVKSLSVCSEVDQLFTGCSRGPNTPVEQGLIEVGAEMHLGI